LPPVNQVSRVDEVAVMVWLPSTSQRCPGVGAGIPNPMAWLSEAWGGRRRRRGWLLGMR
jgi:hypothetical protein